MRYLASIAALGLLVAFHELGHFLLARAFKIRVDKFAIGFGPALLSFRARGVDWVIGAIPLGGYVKIRGMNPHEDGVEEADSFAKAKAYKRALILAGGSLANYLLAIIVMFFLLLLGTHVVVPNTVGIVQAGSEAARAQLKTGDQIVAINGEKVTEWMQIVEKVNDSPNVALTFTVSREGAMQDIVLRPRPDASGTGRIGVAQQYVFREHGPGHAAALAFTEVNTRAAEGFRLLWRLVRFKSGVQLGSPVMIVKQAADAASFGVDAFFRIVVAISVALAIFNLLPVPALDGGRLLFVAIEAATGRPVNPKLETLLHTLGFLALITLLIFVAMRDVVNLVGGSDKQVPPVELTGDGGAETSVAADAGR